MRPYALPPDPSMPGPDDADASAQVDVVGQIIRVLAILRRRWLVVAITMVLAATAAVLGLSVAQPRWRAEATLVVHMNGPQVLDKVRGVSEEIDNGSGYREYYETQRRIIGSRAVAERALQSLGLSEDPVFLGIDDVKSEAERLAKAASIDPVERLQQLINVEEIRGSRIIKIHGEYPNPDIAAEITNAVAEAYLAHVRRNRSEQGSEAKDNLATEREKSRHALHAAEKNLDEFKRSRGITSISLEDRQNVITQNILQLSQRAKEAAAERIRIANVYAQAKQLHARGNLAGATLLSDTERELFESLRKELVEAERDFEKAKVTYGEKHGEYQKALMRMQVIQGKVVREGNDLIDGLAARLEAAKNTERDLETELSRERKLALEVTALEPQYRQLDLEAQTAKNAYQLVAMRDTEIGMTNRVETENIEMLDRATVPGIPVYPRKMLFLAITIAAGLLAGSLLALVVDLRDHRLRSLADLERALSGFGMPVLGQLPVLPADTRLGVGNVRAQRRQRDLYTFLFPQSLMAERCRGVRTSLAFAEAGEAIRTIMITSPNSSEGKSSTAINLALSFCQANKKVVLVDADMRRPRIHQVFPGPIERETVGLAAVLSDKIPLDQALLPAGEGAPTNLSLLPCGAIPDNPAELLESANCRRLLAELRDRFDIIILDSPPVLPVTDPLILARQVDGVVVVARCDSTTRGDVQRVLSQLRQGDTNLLGVVLNEVSTRRDRYGYGVEYYAYRPQEQKAENA